MYNYCFINFLILSLYTKKQERINDDRQRLPQMLSETGCNFKKITCVANVNNVCGRAALKTP